MPKRIAFLLLGWILSFPLYAQSYKVENISIDDGLSQNSALAIIQDDKGFIWIGTKDGLNRYDGIRFKVYRYSTQQNSLISNLIRCLYQDRDGNIWIGTNHGLSKLNPATDEITSFQKNDSTGLSNNVITAIKQDSRKNIWIGTRQGLNMIPGIRMESDIPEDKTLAQQPYDRILHILEKEDISCIYEDHAQNIWAGTRGSNFYRISEDTKKVMAYPYVTSFPAGNTNTILTCMGEFDGNRWLAGTIRNGLYIYDPPAEKFISCDSVKGSDLIRNAYIVKVLKYNGNIYVLTNRMLFKITVKEVEIIWYNTNVPSPTDFMIDNSGIIWIGSDGGGLLKLVPVLKKFKTFRKTPDVGNGFKVSSVRALVKTGGKLLVGGYSCLQEAVYNHPDSLISWKNIEAFDHVNIYSMLPDPLDANILWVGTEGNGLYRYDFKTARFIHYGSHKGSGSNYLSARTVYDMMADRNNNIWFATSNGVAEYHHRDQKFTEFSSYPAVQNRSVLSLCEDSNGNIWMGTDGHGISVYDLRGSSFSQWTNSINAADSNSPGNNIVNIIYEDSHHNIWVGTADGLNKYSAESNHLTVYKTGEGLPSDCIYGILEDDSAYLWLSTNKGISKFDPSKNRFQNYDVNFGLQSNEFNRAAYYKSDDGELYFGGIKGFTCFNPNEIIRNDYAPPVIISNFKRFNQPAVSDSSVSYAHEMKLQYNDYFFSFEFIMPEYYYPLHHQFAYKLRGLDDRWIILNNGEMTASFTAVPPGTYTLEVKGANSDGVWSATETRLNIVIKPSYWQTWWFKLSIAGSFLLIMLSLYNHRMNRLKQEKEIQADLTRKLFNSQENERRNISYELHDDLGQNLLVVKNKLLLAERDQNLENSLDTIMEILDESIQDVSNISHLLHPFEVDELGLSQAVESMVFRISAASKLKIINQFSDIDSYFTADDKINVFRIIQEALNNVLKHAHATQVILSDEIKGNSLMISIADNGSGTIVTDHAKSDNRPHIGLKGMKERALMLKGELRVLSVPGKGTSIQIIFRNKINHV